MPFLCLGSDLKLPSYLLIWSAFNIKDVFLINLLYYLDTFVYSLQPTCACGYGLGLNHQHYFVK